MKILIIRHTESVKNTNNTFSSLADDELLTKVGEVAAEQIAKNVRTYISNNKLNCLGLHVANTHRAIMPARFLEAELGVRMNLHYEFKSIKNTTALIGLSEAEVKRRDPVFMNELMLSRAGIFNAYHHSSNLTGDVVRNHEKVVFSKFLELVTDDPKGLLLFVVHHSTLTDIVINLSRRYYCYPPTFYGNIECELGHLFLFDSDKCIFELANVNSYALLSD